MIVSNFTLYNDNIEKHYQVMFDDEIINLLNELVINASYTKKGTFILPYDAGLNGKKNKIVKGAKLSNGQCMFEKIELIREEYVGPDGEGYSVTGTKVFEPQLANIIKRMMNNINSGFYEFINYLSSEELVPIDEKIAKAKKEYDSINDISNLTSVNLKLSALTNLKQLIEDKIKKQYFDTDLLKKYYEEACSLIKCQLIYEKRSMDSKEDSIGELIKTIGKK